MVFFMRDVVLLCCSSSGFVVSLSHLFLMENFIAVILQLRLICHQCRLRYILSEITEQCLFFFFSSNQGIRGEGQACAKI